MKSSQKLICGIGFCLLLLSFLEDDCPADTAYHGITEVLGDVERFEGKKVLLQGFIYLDENEFISLYRGHEDFRNGNSKEAILIAKKGLAEIIKSKNVSDDEIDQHIEDIIGKQWMIEGVLQKVQNAEDYFVPIVQLETVFRLFRSDLSGTKYSRPEGTGSNETEVIPDPFR